MAQGIAKTEKAVLVGIELPGDETEAIKESMDELTRLAETAGAVVVGQWVQKRDRPDAATFLGKGKVQEIADFCLENEVDTIICDRELSSTQIRNLEEATGLKVIDRSDLILDIFALRAKTREGKLQVELAQMNYLLPRLTGQGMALSRLGGGIGTRGPGETKLEMDRRKIRKRISDLSKELEQVKRHRQILRKGRLEHHIPQVSIVGYTNAGKSTLLNKLTGAVVLAEDKLFATLDTTTRGLLLPNNERILLTDTVGFINNLPHHLVAAFSATLEEVVEADVLLHVIDSSHPNASRQAETVMNVLKSLGAGEKPMITVYNKCDLLSIEQLHSLSHEPNIILISALTGFGLDTLLNEIAAKIEKRRVIKSYTLSFSDYGLLKALHEKGKIIKEEHFPEGLRVEVELEEIWANKIEAMLEKRKANDNMSI